VEGDTDKRAPRVSGSERLRARVGPAGRAWARPTREQGAGSKRAAAKAAETGRNPDEMNFSSLFLFPIFQSKFSKDFQIKFEFDLNHSIQNFKCSSMNAQSCFYPYI
jgi:hypothetical protein